MSVDPPGNRNSSPIQAAMSNPGVAGGELEVEEQFGIQQVGGGPHVVQQAPADAARIHRYQAQTS
jgi:hypothetical protein